MLKRDSVTHLKIKTRRQESVTYRNPGAVEKIKVVNKARIYFIIKVYLNSP